MKISIRYFSSALILGSIILTASCKKTKTVYEFYTVPTTYNFENVDYAEATARVNMWSGLTSYLGKGTSRQLSQDTANFLWANTGNAFTAEIVVNLPNTFTDLNASSFDVSEKTTEAANIKKYIDSMVAVSAFYSATGSAGVPGKIGSRLFNYSGLEFNQLVAKGLMGAFIMHEIIHILDEHVPAANNTTVVTGQGTAMEHQWDLAFGYASLPEDYDTATNYSGTSITDRPLALGGYFKERGSFIGAGVKVFDAFLKGRAAISANDYATRDEAAATIKEYMEKTLAAAAYAYAGIGITGGDIPARFHGLSEGYGSALALKYRPADSPLTEVNYQTLLNIFKTNFYVLDADATHALLNQAQDILADAYGQLQP